MAQGAQEERWNHTSAILAQHYNANRGKRSAMSPQDFHPFVEQRAVPIGNASDAFRLFNQSRPA